MFFSFFFTFFLGVVGGGNGVLKEVHVSKRAFRRVQGNVPCKNVNCRDMHLKVINETKRLIAIIQRRLLCMDMRFKPFIPEISRSNLQFKRSKYLHSLFVERSSNADFSKISCERGRTIGQSMLVFLRHQSSHPVV